jgi:hypothetical protein
VSLNTDEKKFVSHTRRPQSQAIPMLSHLSECWKLTKEQMRRMETTENAFHQSGDRKNE